VVTVVMVVTAAMVVIVVMAGGVRRPYGALQWVVGDPVAESVAGSGRLPAAGSGRKQAVCDKWKIAYRRKLIGGLQAITPITRRGLLVVVGAGNGLADYDVIARPLDKSINYYSRASLRGVDM